MSTLPEELGTECVMAQQKQDRTGKGLLLIISGPSGVGKSTITHHVERELDGMFSVSVTTRPKAPEDMEGRDYYFIDRDEFERWRDGDRLLEWAEVFGHYYGTPRQPVADALTEGRLVLLEIDVEGAAQIKQKTPDAYALFVLPPGEDDLLERLRRRAREDEQVIQGRFAKAKHEIAQARRSGVYDQFVVNDDLAAAVKQAVGLVRTEWDRRRSTISPES